MTRPTAWARLLEFAAQELSRDDREPDAWFVRGVADAMCGCAYDPPAADEREWRRAYDDGWDGYRSKR